MTINELFISGARVVRDAVLREAGQIFVANFTIAINHSFKKGEEWVEDVSFFDCIKWNASPALVDSLKKGAPLTLTGRIKQEKWTDKNGMVKSATKIIANKIIVHSRAQRADDDSQASTEDEGEGYIERQDKTHQRLSQYVSLLGPLAGSAHQGETSERVLDAFDGSAFSEDEVPF